MSTINKKDSEWIRKSFMIPTRIAKNKDDIRYILTETRFKFTDTTLGGNYAINPPPQFTRHADVIIPSRFSGSKGMGRYYSEAIDDRGQLIHIRCGVPKFNSLTQFFFSFYNPEAANLANKGRSSSAFYMAGRALGFAVSIPLLPIIWAGQVVNFLTKKPASRFYYLKPAMPLYWNAVSSIANTLAVNMGLAGGGAGPGETEIKKEIDAPQPTTHNELLRALSSAPGMVFNEKGGIDIYRMATKAQRLANLNRKNMQAFLENVERAEKLRGDLTERGYIPSEFHKAMMEPIVDPGSGGLDKYLETYHSSAVNKPLNADKEISKDSDSLDGSFEKLGLNDGLGEFFIGELQDGSEFVSFRVDDTGTVSESFSNNTGQSEIVSKLNSISSSARSTRFNFADGNIGGGAVGSIIQSVGSALTDLAKGALDQLQLGGLFALNGSAFVDIPEVWESSVRNAPSMSYTIELRSPYGNPFSRFQNLMVPLSMILAMALPLSTGRQSYTSPFLCEIYSKGRAQARLAIIDSLTITRGVGNLGWTRNHEPLGIDISISFKDLTSVMHMPISPTFGALGAATQGTFAVAGAAADAVAGVTTGAQTNLQGTLENAATLLSSSNFDDDNAFSDYLAVLSSLSLGDQIYPLNKLRLRRAQRLAQWETWKSPARYANWAVGTNIGQFVSALNHVTERGL